MRKRLVLLAAGCAGLLVAAEAASQPKEKIRPATIGRFAVQISAALGYEDSTPEAAARNLGQHGVDLGADLGASLTEGTAARLMADLGFSVSQPAEPSVPVSETRGAALAGTIATLGLPPGPDADRIGLENGFPPILQCLQSPNLGACTQCCVALLPPRFPSGLGNQICTRICMFNNPPASPMSPG